MRISNRTIYAVIGVLALLTISTRLQSNTPEQAGVDDMSLAPQAEPPVSRYLGVRGSSSTSQRAAAEVARKVPVANLPANRTITDEGSRAQPLVADDEPIDEGSTTAEPTIEPSGNVFDDSGMLARTAPAEPARAGELTDQAVYELFVSSLDGENRRSFRATWALMTPEERQDWLVGARTALSN